MNMKMKSLFSVILLCVYSYISAQNTESLHKITYPNIAIKSNLLYDATTTINLGAEFGLGKKTTFEIPINLNAWGMSDNKKFKHWMVQPEFRFWSCEVFNGFFWGIHGHAGQFNVGGRPSSRSSPGRKSACGIPRTHVRAPAAP